MKPNPKDIVNIITLTEEFINTLNTSCATHKVGKLYELKIVDAKTNVTTEQLKAGHKEQRCKRLKFTVSDLETNERLTLYTLDYIVSNPAKLLSAPYRRTLYREFLYNAVGTFGFNLETSIRHRKSEEKLNNPATYSVKDAKLREQPITPEDAYPPPTKQEVKDIVEDVFKDYKDPTRQMTPAKQIEFDKAIKASITYNKYIEFVNTGTATYEDLNSNQDTMSEDLFNRQSEAFKERFK